MLRSSIDDTYLVSKIGTEPEEWKTPEGFVVTAQEMWSVIEDFPLSKIRYNLYASKDSYYISRGDKRLLSKTGDDSNIAKKYGIRVYAKDRKTYEEILKSKDETERWYSIPEINKLIHQFHKIVPTNLQDIAWQ